MNRVRAIGLMSGTSLDGVDGVLLEQSPQGLRVLRAEHTPMPEDLRQAFLALNTPGPDELERSAHAANRLAQLYARTVLALLAGSGLSPGEVVAAGAHGQTVRHRPPAPGSQPDLDTPWQAHTLQLNNPALIAELCGVPVVADFRSRDVAAGGQGAPLVPAFHNAVFRHPGETVAVVNIGGIANATVLTPDAQVLGFDTGPGNALMDAWCQQHTGQPYDAAGRWAASGEVDATLLRLLCADSYFQRTGPRSTGRDHFSLGWLQAQLQHLNRSLAPEDVQATLLELTASSIAAALAGPLDRVILCGGGVFNTTLTAALQRLLGPVRLEPSDLHGLPAMQVEAAAFGWLALQALAGRPGNCTAVTGAQGPRVLGAIYPA